MVSAIILAAGSSSRMGSPKCLLKIGDKTFLQNIVDVLYSARILDIVVVIGWEANKMKNTIGWFEGKVIINENWQNGQLSSIITGLSSLVTKELHGVLICPVDHPVISQGLIVDLLQSFWKIKKDIFIPTYNTRRGHPVLFRANMINDLISASSSIGARQVINRNPKRICEVPTDEEGILLNIDSQTDYDLKILDNPKLLNIR
jgi:molybdenum cofactor cytidylyltransferase